VLVDLTVDTAVVLEDLALESVLNTVPQAAALVLMVPAELVDTQVLEVPVVLTVVTLAVLDPVLVVNTEPLVVDLELVVLEPTVLVVTPVVLVASLEDTLVAETVSAANMELQAVVLVLVVQEEPVVTQVLMVPTALDLVDTLVELEVLVEPEVPEDTAELEVLAVSMVPVGTLVAVQASEVNTEPQAAALVLVVPAVLEVTLALMVLMDLVLVVTLELEVPVVLEQPADTPVLEMVSEANMEPQAAVLVPVVLEELVVTQVLMAPTVLELADTLEVLVPVLVLNMVLQAAVLVLVVLAVLLVAMLAVLTVLALNTELQVVLEVSEVVPEESEEELEVSVEAPEASAVVPMASEEVPVVSEEVLAVAKSSNVSTRKFTSTLPHQRLRKPHVQFLEVQRFLRSQRSSTKSCSSRLPHLLPNKLWILTTLSLLLPSRRPSSTSCSSVQAMTKLNPKSLPLLLLPPLPPNPRFTSSVTVTTVPEVLVALVLVVVPMVMLSEVLMVVPLAELVLLALMVVLLVLVEISVELLAVTELNTELLVLALVLVVMELNTELLVLALVPEVLEVTTKRRQMIEISCHLLVNL